MTEHQTFVGEWYPQQRGFSFTVLSMGPEGDYRRWRQRHHSPAFRRLGLMEHDPTILQFVHDLNYREGRHIKVHILPAQTQKLAATEAGERRQVEDRVVYRPFSSFQQFIETIAVEAFHFFAFGPWGVYSQRNVPGHHSPFDRMGESFTEDPVMMGHCPG